MFRTNTDHLQGNLFGIRDQLSLQQQKRLRKSREHFLYENLFVHIDEKIFEPLYTDNNGRPNAAVNALVTATIMQNHNGWAIDFLMDQVNFNMLTRTALGINTVDTVPFCEATYYNFQNRLQEYAEKSGINLLEEQFNSLTAKQLKALELKTDIQRTDSFQIMTNIKSRSRVELLVEVVIRLYRSLEVELQERVCELIFPYIEENSQQYVYRLKKEDISHELITLGELYYELYEQLRFVVPNDLVAFQTFERVFKEQFIVQQKKVTVKSPKEVGSDSLQSPDDLDATYRSKRGKSYKGYVGTITETASPGNKINLITSVAVDQNCVDDAAILAESLDELCERTPDLSELHVDGGYGSTAVDEKADEHGLTIVQTAVKGRKASVDFDISRDEKSDEITVSCPMQTVVATPARKRMKAEFSMKQCVHCPLADQCPAQVKGKYRTYRFKTSDIMTNQRKRNIYKIPPERRSLRTNVEATVKEFTCGFNQNGKVKVRGIFRTIAYTLAVAFCVNLGRIHRLRMA